MIDKYKYNKLYYCFTEIVSEVLNVLDLSNLHIIADYSLFKPGYDQHTIFHKRYYEICQEHSEFHDLYLDFIKNQVVPKLGWNNILFQRIPTFRIQFPNNVGVGSWHRDKEFNHDENEVNVFLPLTTAFDTNTVWTESEVGLEDFTPLNASIGEYYIWNGANLMHGNKTNETGQTRISVDFRLIQKEHFKDSGLKTVSAGRELKLGDYWIEVN